MPPRRVQLKSSLQMMIAEAKRNFDEQRQCFEREAHDLVEKWHQNSARNFDALQLRISELLLVNDGCSEKQAIPTVKPVEKLKTIEPSMPSLELPSKQPCASDLIKTLENVVEEKSPIQIKNDPMFGFTDLPIVMTSSTAPPTSEPFMDTTFDTDLSSSQVMFSEYELNEIGELTLLSVDIENGNSSKQGNLLNGSLKADQSNHSIPLVKQQANVNRKKKHTTDAIPLKRLKKDENATPNPIKLPKVPQTGLKHKIIIDKETLAQMRKQKQNAKKEDSIKSKAITNHLMDC